MPDVFGFATAEETRAKIRDRFAASSAKVTAQGRNATPGAQVGAALSNIFGGTVQKALDTRAARKDERKRLMETQGLSESEARAQAKLTISPEFSEVRKANRMKELSEGGAGIMDSLIEDGVPAARAQAVGMLEVAKRLSDGGFTQEATAMRSQASELLQQQSLKEAELENLESRTRASDVSAAVQEGTFDANDDTFIKVNAAGDIEDFKSVTLADPERRDELREQGFINIGNSAFGIQFDSADFAGAPKEVPRGTQEDIIGGLNMLSSIDVLRSVNGQTGFIEGPARTAMASLGIKAFNNEGFLDAIAVRRKMRADIQSIIKGIPSNYDAGIFEKMIPDPGAFKSENFFNAQLDVLERSTRDLVELTIAFHQGTQKPIPQAVLNAAFTQGIRVEDIEPMDAGEIKAVQDSPDNNVFTAHQKQLEVQASLFKNSEGTGKTAEQQQEEDDVIDFFLKP